MPSAIEPVVLIVLDGWGIAAPGPDNAVTFARTPTMDRLWTTYPHTTLKTSGLDVGLPEGQMGNSEVGHSNIGAGYVVYQSITRIDQAIQDGSFQNIPLLHETILGCIDRGGALHCLGLVGSGGVHSHSNHLVAIVETAAKLGLRRVYVHAFTDGRDSSPTSGREFVREIQDAFQRMGTGRIASVSGRYYAMDRDKRWERTQQAYSAIAEGVGAPFTSALACIDHAYRTGTTDEFVVPSVVIPPGASLIRMLSEDAVIFFNFRADRGRQLLQAISEPGFDGFHRVPELCAALHVVTMTHYVDGQRAGILFEPDDVAHPLAQAVSSAGLSQLHVAETEKYAHVTFFLNGGREEPFPGEERTLVPSPRVATYDLKPEMSALDICDAVVSAIDNRTQEFVIVNFANGDMVGHTGNLDATVKAIETVDSCLGRIVASLERAHGTALVTADHGNAEEMRNPETGEILTAHTTNPVPCILVTPEDSPFRHAKLRDGGTLSAVAPTVLQLLGVSPPPEMTTPSLISRS